MFFNLIEKTMDVFAEIVAFPLMFLLLPLILWAISFVFLKRIMKRHVHLAAFFLSSSILIYIYALVFGWIMRDGLGPGAVTSHGALMMKRLISNAAISALLTTPTSTLFLWCYSVGRKSKQQSD